MLSKVILSAVIATNAPSGLVEARSVRHLINRLGLNDINLNAYSALLSLGPDKLHNEVAVLADEKRRLQ